LASSDCPAGQHSQKAIGSIGTSAHW
jgi:hypothetical protein